MNSERGVAQRRHLRLGTVRARKQSGACPHPEVTAKSNSYPPDRLCHQDKAHSFGTSLPVIKGSLADKRECGPSDALGGPYRAAFSSVFEEAERWADGINRSDVSARDSFGRTH